MPWQDPWSRHTALLKQRRHRARTQVCGVICVDGAFGKDKAQRRRDRDNPRVSDLTAKD
ncbi:hypothetical protein KGA66_26170 [Actinocrinis puniceicyclus]|uniref:Uncharacterized protein n=1 Tax=Actinocrinis puniceicyclus TaxID=977794 RepID=A0A8J7WU69_9ACTN|nr:hypothetical protein [Actinocrinis puniceicyclus]MBS2966552.1 hypothetical protein [Actinocrinis puniceicyclus]